MNRLRNLPVDLIDDPARPIRSYTDEGKLNELKTSMGAVGLIEPIVVFQKGERFEVIAGHRRLMAAQQLGWREIPSVCYKSAPEAIEAIKLHENVNREDLNPADEAQFFAELLPLCGDDTDKLAEKVRATRQYVEGRLMLLQGDPAVMEALAQEKISFAVAEELNKFQQEWYRRDCLYHAVEGGASARLVRMWRSKETTPAAAPVGETTNGTDRNPVTTPPPASVFQCEYCQGTDEVFEMELVYIHRPCRRILQRALGKAESQG